MLRGEVIKGVVGVVMVSIVLGVVAAKACL
jgi:hypothetical protein